MALTSIRHVLDETAKYSLHRPISEDSTKNITTKIKANSNSRNKKAINATAIRSHHVDIEGLAGGAASPFEETGA